MKNIFLLFEQFLLMTQKIFKNSPHIEKHGLEGLFRPALCFLWKKLSGMGAMVGLGVPAGRPGALCSHPLRTSQPGGDNSCEWQSVQGHTF